MEGSTVERSLVIWWNEHNNTKDNILRNSGFMCTAISRGRLYNHVLIIQKNPLPEGWGLQSIVNVVGGH